MKYYSVVWQSSLTVEVPDSATIEEIRELIYECEDSVIPETIDIEPLASNECKDDFERFRFNEFGGLDWRDNPTEKGNK